jgi:hypothetical protein
VGPPRLAERRDSGGGPQASRSVEIFYASALKSLPAPFGKGAAVGPLSKGGEHLDLLAWVCPGYRIKSGTGPDPGLTEIVPAKAAKWAAATTFG